MTSNRETGPVAVAAGILACIMTGPLLASGSAAEPQPFAFGVEYMVPGLARIYAATGATWAKAAPAGFDWGTIEPRPPTSGRHNYDFTIPDTLLREYQEAGFRNFHIYLQCRNPWATSKPLPKRGHPSYPPKPEFLDDYAAYVRAMVERYDADGHEDMPGLLYPVRYWEIEAEWGTFWPASVAEYLDLLRIAHPAVKQADPQAQVILQGFLLWGIFEGDPDRTELQRRLADPKYGPGGRALLTGIGEVLAHPQLFDAVEYHSLSDWTEVFGTARFLREEMRKRGYEKPIWAGDVNFNINPMLWWGQPNYPYTAAQKPAILKWLAAMKNPRDQLHAQAEKWFRAEQARFTAKKLISCMGEGLAGINMGNLEDWEVFSILPQITGTAGFCGLIDRKPPRRMDEPRVPGKPRPAYWTMKLVIEKLGRCHSPGRLSGLGKHVYAWRFQASGPGHSLDQPESIIALWYEPPIGLLPNQPLPRREVELPTAAQRILATPIITEIGQTQATSTTIRPNRGQVRLTISAAPVLLEEMPQ
ncbi:MAG: hypothetical protein N2512_07370 [Armatimonadetes bacterium]|nr:hypothetical protein [Armatimonadota bacterium]